MKATELMIGDYIKDVNDGDIITAVELGETSILCSDGIYRDYDEIEELPITPGILEKNGFICLDDGGIQYEWYDWILKGTNFSFHFYNDCGEIDIANFIKEFKYIHELQHCLRICGLEELANNFKI